MLLLLVANLICCSYVGKSYIALWLASRSPFCLKAIAEPMHINLNLPLSMILFLHLLLHLQFMFGLARPPPKDASGGTELSAFVDPPNCFPALGFKMPASVPSSLTNWWCNPAKEYAFLGFSYEVTACTKLDSPFVDDRHLI